MYVNIWTEKLKGPGLKKKRKFHSLCDGGVIAMMLITFPHSLKESEEDKINRIKFTKFNKKRECGMCMLQNSYYSGHFFFRNIK